MKLPCNILTMAVIAFASPAAAVDKTKVLDTYANIAAAKFDDSLITAQRLKSAVTKLINIPSGCCKLYGRFPSRNFQTKD